MRARLYTIWTIGLTLFFLAGVSRAEDAQRPGLDATANMAGRKKIVFISGPPSHGFAAHEHYAGSMLLAKDLNENVPQIEAEVYKWTWPADLHAFDNAAAIIIYCDGGDGHIAIAADHLKQLSELMDKGVGLGCIHYGVEVPKEKGGPEFLKWIGGYFETNWSINPNWEAHFTNLPQHEISRGVNAFTIADEWYYHMRFRPEMAGVTSILSAIPPDKTRQGKDDAHGGNPAVRDGIGKNISETVLWVSTRDNNGRGFGCTGGHHHFNWAQDDFRKTVLNSIAWIAHVEVPATGVNSRTPTLDDLLVNQDEPVPANFNRAQVIKQIEQMNAKKTVEEK